MSGVHLLDFDPEALRAWLAERGLPKYRAAQLRRWIFHETPDDFERMSDLPKPLRRELGEALSLWTSRVVREQSADDGTQKLLLELGDGARVECVLLRDDRQHRTVCISTQVGCGVGCVFCASGLDGVARNLTSGEIIEQILRLKRLLAAGERLSHVVVMGMGEPLANLDRLLGALDSATASDALDIGARRVTISTVGLPQGIRRLAAHTRPYHLAVSLHAPDDALRDRIVPANRTTGLEAILAATDDYFQATGRRVTFEYVLLADLNDRAEHARKLVALLTRAKPATQEDSRTRAHGALKLRGTTPKSHRGMVNLIPYNPVAGLPYRAPTGAACTRFAEILEEARLTVTLRYRKGNRIDAACGQLRRQSP